MTYLLLLWMLLGQDQVDTQAVEKWQPLELNDQLHDLCHKDFVRFWRLKIDGHLGMWHLYNEEDKKFLAEMAQRIRSGQYAGGEIQWFALEGRLPK